MVQWQLTCTVLALAGACALAHSRNEEIESAGRSLRKRTVGFFRDASAFTQVFEAARKADSRMPMLPHEQRGLQLVDFADEEDRRKLTTTSANYLISEWCPAGLAFMAAFSGASWHSYSSGVILDTCLLATPVDGGSTISVKYYTTSASVAGFQTFSDTACTTLTHDSSSDGNTLPLGGNCDSATFAVYTFGAANPSEMQGGLVTAVFGGNECSGAAVEYTVTGLYSGECLPAGGEYSYQSLSLLSCDTDIGTYAYYSDAACTNLILTASGQLNTCDTVDDDDPSIMGMDDDETGFSLELVKKKKYCKSLPSSTTVDADDAESAASVCFPADATMLLSDGSRSALTELRVGDEVLTYAPRTGKAEFSAVVSVPHGRGSAMSTTRMRTLDLGDGGALRTTPTHLIGVVSAASCVEGAAPTPDSLSLVEAQRVEAGACVVRVREERGELVKVRAARTERTQEPVLSVVTMNGELLVVDGVAASSFAVMHAVPTLYYAPHRLLYALGLRDVLESAIVDVVGSAAGAAALYALSFWSK